MKLVAIYPSDGTYMSDNPFLVMHAPWVSAERSRAATVLGDWLRRRLTPTLVAHYDYRPGGAARPTGPVNAKNGADPLQPRRLLTLPQPDVLARIKDAWRQDRKAANILLLVDASGSMNDSEKIDQARVGLAAFLHQLSPRDRVGLTVFATSTTPLVPLAPFAQDRALLRARVHELVASGSTSLYDATSSAWSSIDALRDESRINAVVLLSDGADTSSNGNLESLLRTLRARTGSEGRQVRIFTIAYGKDASSDVLDKIAAASGGKAYTGDPKTISSVYLQISSFF
jgi:Ca-activated chloride channel family protein